MSRIVRAGRKYGEIRKAGHSEEEEKEKDRALGLGRHCFYNEKQSRPLADVQPGADQMLFWGYFLSWQADLAGWKSPFLGHPDAKFGESQRQPGPATARSGREGRMEGYHSIMPSNKRHNNILTSRGKGAYGMGRNGKTKTINRPPIARPTRI